MGGSESDAVSKQEIKNKTKIAVKNTLEHIQNCGGTLVNDMSQTVVVAGTNSKIIDFVLEQNNVLNQPEVFRCVQETRSALENRIASEQEADAKGEADAQATGASTAVPILGAAGQVTTPLGSLGGSVGGILILVGIALLVWWMFFS
tara:strand:+ start:271 stop:711 length:441 start_codon:yes stop_codon:yes gene_type:complete